MTLTQQESLCKGCQLVFINAFDRRKQKLNAPLGGRSWTWSATLFTINHLFWFPPKSPGCLAFSLLLSSPLLSAQSDIFILLKLAMQGSCLIQRYILSHFIVCYFPVLSPEAVFSLTFWMLWRGDVVEIKWPNPYEHLKCKHGIYLSVQ